MTLTESQQLAYANAQAADARLNLEVETDDGMVLNMGPQHPDTHGTLRLADRLDGEPVVSDDVLCGYMHRGYEKLSEVRTYLTVNTVRTSMYSTGRLLPPLPFLPAANYPLAGTA